MSKLILLSIVLLFGLMLAIPTLAQEVPLSSAGNTIVGSAHDLTSGGVSIQNPNTDRVCVFCHTPHDNTVASPPLWNNTGRDGDGTGFTMYDSPTMDMLEVTNGQPVGVSLACLGCHDGVTAMDSLLQAPDGYSALGTVMGSNPTSGGLNVWTTDLSAEHPISIVLDVGNDAGFNTTTDIRNNGVPLFGTNSDQVECASCHNPHRPGDPLNSDFPFLRKTVAESALCVKCHIK
jgi:predicted CXXCH cytochrome family protein